ASPPAAAAPEAAPAPATGPALWKPDRISFKSLPSKALA
ncbi:hypothetical protein AWRI1631_41080, partial [Saccharomyces cerevisiae AWRI1631]